MTQTFPLVHLHCISVDFSSIGIIIIFTYLSAFFFRMKDFYVGLLISTVAEFLDKRVQ